MATPHRKKALSFFCVAPDDLLPDNNGHQPNIGEGFFSFADTKAWIRLADSLEAIQSNSKTYQTYFTKLDRMIAKEPDYLEAYNYAGGGYLELSDKATIPEEVMRNVNLAYQYYLLAYERAKQLIPTDFSGRIGWGRLDNRPFLRVHHGLILCHLRKKEYAKAAQMIEEHLSWNPDDNVGVRYLLGDAYLLSGVNRKARKTFKTTVMAEGLVPQPDNAYSLGLLEFTEGNYAAAATALRIGFIGNMYIAEIITGRIVEKRHFFWHSSSEESISSAKSYLYDLNMLHLWKTTPKAVDFLDWLYNCAIVLRERLELAEVNEGLTYENDYKKRGEYVYQKEALRINIRKVPMLIQKVTDSRGEVRWPWEYSQPGGSILDEV